MMGCGKTTVAQALAGELGWQAVDTDKELERKFGLISRIFAERGEMYFRALETSFAESLSSMDDKTVLSVGGGFVLCSENVAHLSRMGKIVYLRARKETLYKRLEGDKDRPLLQGEGLSQKLDTLLSQREGIYEKVSDFAVDVDEKTPAEIASEILRVCLERGYITK